MDMLSLEQKYAVVCGSTQGIGRAIAHQLATMGAHVILLARNAQALQEVCEGLPVSGSQKHQFFVADFSQPDALRQVAKTIAERFPVHILVNNTGGPAGGAAIDAPIAAYLAAFEQHLICNQLLTSAFVPSMKAANFGRIINIISTSVKQPLKGLGVSNTIRGAVANWSKTLATELGPFGITVNNVLPGATQTERLSSIISNKANKIGLSQEEVSAQMLAEIPAGRFASAEEIAHAACFLAQPLSGYINGINLPVDGGRTSCL